jgi:UDP-N-acetylmuramoylalanine--D-glutamate ligase
MKKELYEDFFFGKNVTVMGLGLLGRGVGDTYFLADVGANLVVTDKKTKEELASSLEVLKDFPDIIYHLGGHMLSDFEKKSFIIKAAGVPYDSEYIEHAKLGTIPVYMSAALVSHLIAKHDMGVTIIGVTGTRGKSTTTHFIAHVLRSCGLRVHVGGNVRGVANLPLLALVEDSDYIVFELDSWQLQGFGDLKISPNIAVFTSFMDDHMNYYKNDKEQYFKDKSHIYAHQTEYDVLIASKQAQEEILKRDKVKAIVPDTKKFEMKLIGEHNQIAAALTYEVAIQCGLEDKEIREAIETFNGVEGRLEDCGLYGPQKNIRVFNDNNATTADATIAAIDAINEVHHKKPILIIGGADKGLSLSTLEDIILIGVKECIYLEGTGTSRLTLPKKYVFETLEDCVEKAFELAVDGDIILFSPSFASFSKYFNNEYEKNDAFMAAIKKYE